jgi:hypothetical protein
MNVPHTHQIFKWVEFEELTAELIKNWFLCEWRHVKWWIDTDVSVELAAAIPTVCAGQQVWTMRMVQVKFSKHQWLFTSWYDIT